MASIRDVANAAGVSTATVSNVLNGRSEKVSEETRDKVLAAIRQLKYRPTPLEDRQRAIISQNIGVMVPDLTENPFTRNAYLRNVFEGVLETSARGGFSVTIFVERVWDDVGLAVRRSYDGRCDGLILIAPQPGNEVVQTLTERGTPLVLVGTTPWLGNVSSADVDNAIIGATAAQHLIGLGHTRLAYLNDGREQVSSVERRESFFSEARKSGIPDRQMHWLTTPKAQDEMVRWEGAAHEILAIPERPTGIFCWNDGVALLLMRTLLALGYGIPEDFSIMGVDSSENSASIIPSITTFENPQNELGKRAAQMIIDRLTSDHDSVEILRLPPRLVVRGSTGPAPKSGT